MFAFSHPSFEEWILIISTSADGTKQLCDTLSGVCVAQLFHVRSRPNLVQAQGAHNWHGPRKQSEKDVILLFFLYIFVFGLSLVSDYMLYQLMEVIAKYSIEAC